MCKYMRIELFLPDMVDRRLCIASVRNDVEFIVSQMCLNRNSSLFVVVCIGVYRGVVHCRWIECVARESSRRYR